MFVDNILVIAEHNADDPLCPKVFAEKWLYVSQEA